MKLHTRTHQDDYGLLVNGEQPYIHMFESGILRVRNGMKPVPVIKVTAHWMKKDIRVACDVADTNVRKRKGLQGYKSLDANRGMYFPYPGYCDVTFHQGSVSFPLDLIFLRDGFIIDLIENTKVGDKDRWSCIGCDGVLEVSGGFCKENDVNVQDLLVFFAFSNKDIQAYKEDRIAIKVEADLRKRSESLIHSIIGEDFVGFT